MNNMVQLMGTGLNDLSPNRSNGSNPHETGSENMEFVKYMQDLTSRDTNPLKTRDHSNDAGTELNVETQDNPNYRNLLGIDESKKPSSNFLLNHIPEELLGQLIQNEDGELIQTSSNVDSTSLTAGNTNEGNSLSNLIPGNLKLLMNNINGEASDIKGLSDAILKQMTQILQDNGLESSKMDHLKRSFDFKSPETKTDNSPSNQLKGADLTSRIQGVQDKSNLVEEEQPKIKGKETTMTRNIRANPERAATGSMNIIAEDDRSGELQALIRRFAGLSKNGMQNTVDFTSTPKQNITGSTQNSLPAAEVTTAQKEGSQTQKLKPDTNKPRSNDSKPLESTDNFEKKTTARIIRNTGLSRHGKESFGQQSSQQSNKYEQPVTQESKVNNAPTEKDTQSAAVSESKTQQETASGLRNGQQVLKGHDQGSEFKIMSNPDKNFTHESGFRPTQRGGETEILNAKNAFWNVDQKDVVDQVLRKVVLNVKSQKSEFFMKLEPDFLGSVRFRVQLNGEILTARVFTDTAMAKQILEQNAHILTNALSEQGIRVEKFQVEVSNNNQTDEFSNLKHDHQGNSGQDDEIFNRHSLPGFYPEGSTQTDDTNHFNHNQQHAHSEGLIDIMI